jgi:short-subunit dehydrogenase
MNWSKKIIVVTGGSEGLGREIGLAFARQGATLVALARHEDRLKLVASEFAEQSLSFDWIVTDVTNDASVREAVAEILQRHGRIDAWVNNVGKSTRAAVMESNVDQYREFMELNFYSAVRCSLAVLEHLTSSSGHLVNVGSLASKTGYPLMAPYSASKHALAAFHHQLQIEAPANVHFLHVCPGPIQRSDQADRYADQAAGLGDTAAAKPGGGVKMKGIPPRVLADKIVRACERRKTELVIPGYTRILFALRQLFPRLADWILLRSKKK